MNILLTTGIYPPAIGGPAKYAQKLMEEWEKAGHRVTVKTFTEVEHSLPTLVRHFYFFLKIIPNVIACDFIYALDTFSVGWPSTIAAKIFGKKIILRTGGDFLWEGYAERTQEKVLLKDFYIETHDKWSEKEKVIFKLTRWTLRHVTALVFSTKWQHDIFIDGYGLNPVNTYIMENFYDVKLPSTEPVEKNFIAGTRKLSWKNLDLLEEVFKEIPVATLDLNNYPHEEFMKKISQYYATILVSFGDISPNMILESIRYNKPFIITQENGLMDRIGNIAITVDPKNPADIREKILWLCEKQNYDAQVEKIKNFTFTHTWAEIAQEIIELYKKL